MAIGEIAGFSHSGMPLVKYDTMESPEPLEAASTVDLSEATVGQRVALGFLNGDRLRPIAIGLIWEPHHPEPNEATKPASVPNQPVVTVDGDHVSIAADRELVLRCGKSTITLTRAGKILIRGAYLLSRSSGVNRIKGGSVQIN